MGFLKVVDLTFQRRWIFCFEPSNLEVLSLFVINLEPLIQTKFICKVKGLSLSSSTQSTAIGSLTRGGPAAPKRVMSCSVPIRLRPPHSEILSHHPSNDRTCYENLTRFSFANRVISEEFIVMAKPLVLTTEADVEARAECVHWSSCRMMQPYQELST